MQEWQTVAALTLMAGMAMPLGVWIAQAERLGANWLETELRHGIIAFGGGAMLSDFVPEALALGAAFAHGGSGGHLLIH
jgi:ZIP family zinc transporter